jgi:phage tail protein X
MRVTSLNTETSLAAIAQRIYVTDTDILLKTAESALLNANPNLAESKAFRPGTVIHVPDVPSLTLKVGLLSQGAPIGHTSELLIQALDRYGTALEKSNETVKVELDAHIHFLDRPDVIDHQINDSEMTAIQVQALLKKGIEDHNNHTINQITALKQATKDLEALFKSN